MKIQVVVVLAILVASSSVGFATEALSSLSKDFGKLLKTLTGHTAGIATLALKNGSLISGSEDSTIRVYQPGNFGVEHTLVTQCSYVRRVAAMPDGNIISSCVDGPDRVLRVWRADFNGLKCFINQTSNLMSLVALTGTFFATGSGSEESTINIWDQNECTHVRTISGHSGTVHALALLRNGDLISGSYDGTLELGMTTESKALINIFYAQTACKKNRFGEPKQAPQNIGVLGAGLMGAGIAAVSIDKGYKIIFSRWHLGMVNHAFTKRPKSTFGAISFKCAHYSAVFAR